MTREEMLGALRRIVEALGPYSADAVLAGGFVPLVYRECGLFGQAPHAALLSGDIDLVLDHDVPMHDKTLREYLSDHDYLVVLSRSTEPPIQYFQPAEFGDEELSPFYVEFLAPLSGPTTYRDGSPKSPAEIQKGLTAQLLRYMELLLAAPIAASLADRLEVRVPNPASFVVQKVLASELRSNPEKADKDFAYVYDMALLTRGRWDQVSDYLKQLPAHQNWLQKASAILDKNFVDADARGPRSVVRILSDQDPASAPSETAVYNVVRAFRTEIGL